MSTTYAHVLLKTILQRFPLQRLYLSSMKRFVPADRIKGLEKNIWAELGVMNAKYSPVHLGQGFTDFSPPRVFLEELAKAALSPNHLLNQYSRTFGHLPLVNRLAELYTMLLGQSVDPLVNVLVADGAYNALFYCALGLLNPGDEAILIEPFFDCYEPQIRMAGGVPKLVLLRQRPKTGKFLSSSDYYLDPDDLEKAVSQRTKVLYLNNPMNPNGKVFTKKELEAVAAFAKRHNIVVIADEVYGWMVYEKARMHHFASLPGMWQQTVTIGSAGKMFSLTGWKLGWAIAPNELLMCLKAVHQNCVNTCPTPIQEAVARCLELEMSRIGSTDCYFKSLPVMLQSKRDQMATILADSGFEPVIPDGGYFMLADYTKHANNVSYTGADAKDYQFTQYLCKEKV